MKIIYHGGLEIIENPEIRESNRTLDFGSGFYLTSSEKQAEDWVRRCFSTGATLGYVNTYVFDIDTAKSELNIKEFYSATEEWLDFVMANRRIPNFSHCYDIVIGPVANDRVYTAFSLFEGGVIDKQTLIKELKTYRLVDQYLFHTTESLKLLSYTSAKIIVQ